MKICFLENTKFEYSYKDIHSPKLRGAENILIKHIDGCYNNIVGFPLKKFEMSKIKKILDSL